MLAPTIDVTKANVSQTLPYERPLMSCAVSPCGRFVFAGGQHESVLRYTLESGDKTELVGHASWVEAVVVSAQGNRLFSADFRGGLHAWPYDAAHPKSLWSKADAHQGAIRTLAVTAEGNVLSAGNDRVIRLWSGATGELIREYQGHENYVFSLAVHPDGKSFVSGDLFGKVHQWAMDKDKPIRTFDASVLHTRGDDFLADIGGARSLAFDSTGKQLACGGMTDIKSNTFCPGKPAILVFETSTGKLLQTLRPQHKSDGPIKGLTFIADDLLAGHAEHLNGQSSLEFWKPDTPTSIHMIKRQSGYCISMHPDGQRMAVASFVTNGSGGNGRNSKLDEYTSHNGEVAIFSFTATE